jgi:cytochrome P450
MPVALQTVGWWARPTAYLQRCRATFGRRFTVRLAAQRPFVMISDPAELKQVFTAPPEVLHPGEGGRILEPIVGPNSILLLDEDRHLAQRRLVLPAFGGERIARLEGVVAEAAEREIARLPRGEEFSTHAHMQALTLDVILRAVFGLGPGERLESLRAALASMLEFGFSPISLLPPLQRSFGGRGAWARFARARARADELIYAEIAHRRAELEVEGAAGVAAEPAGDDILAAFIAATHEDGAPMSDEEIHDELLTLLVAGHETTATSLSWGLERLARHPEALARLTEEVRTGDEDEYLTATIREIMRRRPVLPTAQPRTVKQPIEVGGWSYPDDAHLMPCIWLTHHDPEIYPDPFAFRPERFLDSEPGTYTWLPFGGGRRRCAGANFAILEMKVVLRELLRQTSPVPSTEPNESVRRRAITIAPDAGGRISLRERQADPAEKAALAASA